MWNVHTFHRPKGVRNKQRTSDGPFDTVKHWKEFQIDISWREWSVWLASKFIIIELVYRYICCKWAGVSCHLQALSVQRISLNICSEIFLTYTHPAVKETFMVNNAGINMNMWLFDFKRNIWDLWHTNEYVREHHIECRYIGGRCGIYV